MREKSVEALNLNYDQMFVSLSARVSTHRREDCREKQLCLLNYQFSKIFVFDLCSACI